MKVRIALIQMNTVLGGLEANADRHLHWIEEARAAGADLAVFPELSLTGYGLQDLVPQAALQPGNSPLFQRLQAASQHLDVLFGFVEEDRRGRYYIAAAYVSRGELLHIHRKVYLPTYSMFDEKRFFTPGGRVRAFDTRFGRLGVLICEDLWHISTPYLLWLDGADLFLCHAASPGHGLDSGARLESDVQVQAALETYAGLFTACFAYTNRVGYEDGMYFPGGALLADPGGKVKAQAGSGEGLLLAEADLGQVRRKRFRLPLLRDERPELVQRELARILRAQEDEDPARG